MTKNCEYAAAKFILDAKSHQDYMKVLVVQDGIARATNGRVLLTFETAMPDGAYVPVRVTKKEVTWVKAETTPAFPDTSGLDTYTQAVELLSDNPDHVTAEVAINAKVALSSKWVKIYSYLDIKKYEYTNDRSPVIFRGDRFVLYVMPVILD